VLAADEALLDAPPVHLPEGHRDRVVVGAVQLLRDAPAHVLDGEGEALLRLRVLGLAPDEVVLGEVLVREADRRVDEPDAGRHAHALLLVGVVAVEAWLRAQAATRSRGVISARALSRITSRTSSGSNPGMSSMKS